MAYMVKEIFHSIQGEGLRAGRPAVFLRFSGCNLWTGREADRESADCPFCDTDFVGGTRYAEAEALAEAVADLWPEGRAHRYVVVTGGEPLLQLDAALIEALHRHAFEIAVETNGTLPAPAGIDWLCVSPKAGAELKQTSGDELKLVWPQAGLEPADFEALAFGAFLLQPLDAGDAAANAETLRSATAYCLAHPQWRLGLQTHKIIGVR